MLEDNDTTTLEQEELDDISLFCSDVITLKNSDEIEIHGSDQQRQEMFRDWALYFGEVTNPDNTTLNTFFKAKYAPLNEVLNTIRPIMSKHGLFITQTIFQLNGDPCVKTIVAHKGGGLMSFPAVAGRATKNDIQGFGSTASYLRRFAVNAVAGVMGEIDNDGNPAKLPKASRTPQTPQTPQASTPKEPTKEELELKSIHEQILRISAAQIESGVDKEIIYAIFADNNNGKKNPNSIRDVEIAKKVLIEVEKLNVEKSEV